MPSLEVYLLVVPSTEVSGVEQEVLFSLTVGEAAPLGREADARAPWRDGDALRRGDITASRNRNVVACGTRVPFGEIRRVVFCTRRFAEPSSCLESLQERQRKEKLRYWHGKGHNRGASRKLELQMALIIGSLHCRRYETENLG